MATVSLRSVGNPDYRQDPDRPLWGVRDKTVRVTTLRQASKVCLSWIDKNDLSGGNWAGGEVLNSKGEWVARVSYNGRVWNKPKWSPGDEDVSGDLLDKPIDEE